MELISELHKHSPGVLRMTFACSQRNLVGIHGWKAIFVKANCRHVFSGGGGGVGTTAKLVEKLKSMKSHCEALMIFPGMVCTMHRRLWLLMYSMHNS